MLQSKIIVELSVTKLQCLAHPCLPKEVPISYKSDTQLNEYFITITFISSPQVDYGWFVTRLIKHNA